MLDNINFKKYRYFYNGAIFRMDRTTKKVERFLDGKFWPISPTRSFDDFINDPRDDMSELEENSQIDLNLLKRTLSNSK